MSQCIVPNWNLSPQRQEQVEPEEGNRSSHVHSLQTLHSVSSHLLPMSEYEIAELTWENGQLAMHGLGGLPPYPPTKPTWCHPTDTLESIVRQAAFHKQTTTPNRQAQAQAQVYAGSASPSRKCADSSRRETMQLPIETKHARLESDYGAGNNICCSSNRPDLSNCASASATFCRDNDTTLMTWTSFESPQSFKTKTTEDDSTWHGGSTIDYFFQENQKEDRDIKRETGRLNSTRRSRAAAIHNQSERKRRDRINQKMKALQKLVPNACKTDKASMLDEVIEYLKQLQAQVQLMSMRNMPQMIMPLGMQQQLQMSMMARMGMGLGLGLGNMARTTPQPLTQFVHPTPQAFVQPPFMMHPMVQPQPKLDSGTNPSVPLPDPFCAYLAQMLRETQLADLQRQPMFFFGQSMNMDLYNKMAALYRQQVNPNTQAGGSSTQSNNVQRN